MMFAVNDQWIHQFEYEQKINQFHRLEAFANGNQAFIGICATDPVFIITMMACNRERGNSVLLLPGGTPLASAREQAFQAGCKWLFYENEHQCYRLNPLNPLLQEHTPSLYQYSSGTTGMPKLIRRSWHEIDIEIEYYNSLLVSQGLADAEPVIVSSLSHSYGLITGVLSALEREVMPSICFSTNPRSMVQYLRNRPDHLLYAVPVLLQVLESALETWDVHLHAVITSGAPLPARVLERLQASSNCMIQQYGCTEAGVISLAVGMTSCDDLGLPLSHVHIPVMTGPAEIKLELWNGTRIDTGDLGQMNEKGRLQFLGRVDDLINVSGRKVQPLEVEQIINQLPEVAEVVVYRGNHPIQGDIVKAQVVACSTLTASHIVDWCLMHLPLYKIPVEIQLVKQIPRLPTGKISRRLLEQREANGI